MFQSYNRYFIPELYVEFSVESYSKKIKIVDNDRCSFCNNEVETIEYVFTSHF